MDGVDREPGQDRAQPDERWHDALFTEFRLDVVRMAARQLGGYGAEAEDVAQQTFMTAWRRRDVVAEDPKAWLFAIARNHLHTHRRRFDRQRVLLAGDDLEQLAGPALPDAHDGVDLRTDLLRPWRQMRPADRELLQLAYLEDLSPTQIALVVGQSPQVVRQRLHRARERLRQLWQRCYDRPGATVAAIARKRGM